MGRRSRSRSAASTPEPAPAPAAGGREGAFDRLSPVRRVLARYLLVAVAISVATVLGIAVLGGTLGPFIVLAYVLASAAVTFRWAQRGLAGQAMGDDDRMLQTMAGGMLLLSVALALIAAVVLTAA